MAKNTKVIAVNERNILTSYFVDGRRLEVVKVNRTNYPRKAAMAALDYMTFDIYPGATVAAVYDENTGRDYAIIVKHKDGRVEITYPTDPKQAEINRFGSFVLRPIKDPTRKQKSAPRSTFHKEDYKVVH